MNRSMLLAVIIAAMISSATTLLTTHWQAQPRKLATLDPGVLIQEHLQGLDPKLDKASLAAHGQVFAKRLNTAVAEVADQYHVVLLIKPAVIMGAPDLTNEVRRRINAPAH